MDKIKVGILGLGTYLPPKILTNKDLEKMVDTSDEWITTRTGIKERRIAEDNVTTSDMAAEAAKKAISSAGLKVADIDLIIVATITPDMAFPSTACLVQKKIGASKAACFDISAACAGYVYAMATAKQFIESGTYKHVLIIGAEKLSSVTDWKDRNTCVLFGDGAGAAVIGKVKRGGILATYLAADGTKDELLNLPGGGSLNPTSHKTVDDRLHYIKMSGSELFKIAVKVMADAGNKVFAMSGHTCKDIACIIPHQANIRILLAVAKMMKLPREKIFLNIEKYGNMSSASSAVAFAEAMAERKFKKGDVIVLDAFGGGLAWGAIAIEI